MKKIPQKYRKARTPKSRKDDSSLFFKGIVGTLLLSLAVGGGLLLLFSLVLTLTPDPLAFVLPFGLLASAITALLGGFFATRIYHLATLGAGLINGILLLSLALLCSLLFGKNATTYATGYSAVVSALLHIALMGFSVGGAFLGAKEHIPNKRHKRKNKR